MNKRQPPVKQPLHQTSAHPETQPTEPQRVPGEESSKVRPTKQGDGRTAQDKDGNEQQSKAPAKVERQR